MPKLSQNKKHTAFSMQKHKKTKNINPINQHPTSTIQPHIKLLARFVVCRCKDRTIVNNMPTTFMAAHCLVKVCQRHASDVSWLPIAGQMCANDMPATCHGCPLLDKCVPTTCHRLAMAAHCWVMVC